MWAGTSDASAAASAVAQACLFHAGVVLRLAISKPLLTYKNKPVNYLILALAAG